MTTPASFPTENNINKPPKTVIVVGSGVFGASTCRALLEAWPSTAVTLIDACSFPSSRAASNDINKIVRADYADTLYMRMTLDAMERWSGSDPLFAPWYHQVGLLRVEKSGFSARCLEAFKALGVTTPAHMIPMSDVRQRWGRIFADGKFGDVERCYWQPDAGWADADKALEAVVQDVVDRGVQYREATVDRLTMASEGICTGVELEGGEVLTADRVILCTGARTAPLLANTAPDNKNIQVGNRLFATGAVTCYARVPEDRWHEFREAPVLSSSLEHIQGESIPLNGDGVIKFNCELAFTRLTDHAASGQRMSAPPDDQSQSEWTSAGVPKMLRMFVRRVLKGPYGNKVADIEPEAYRVCWDSTTPAQDFLITSHPHLRNLYIGAGGAFHAWKMLPILGDYMVRLLEGKLSPEEARRWAWERFDFDGTDRLGQGSANPVYQAKRDWADLLDSDSAPG